MMHRSKFKEYLITIIMQVAILLLFVLFNVFALRFEQVALEPLKYVLPVGIALICLDVVWVIMIFRKTFRESPEEGMRHE